MGTRRLSRLDRLLVGVNNALRTVAAPAGQSPRPNPAANLPPDDLDPTELAAWTVVASTILNLDEAITRG